jgi:NADPH-dependent 2,4-dienoyl-CoA reductase/sulfur reductase-like enzyme
MKTPRSVLIVGAGLAGARCAETLRAEGYDGRLLLVGEEPVPPYERPALSKELLAGVRTPDSLALRAPGYWADLGIELLLGRRICTLDPAGGTAVTTSSEQLTWEALVLATGSRPRRLPFSTPPGVYVLRTLADALALRKELIPGTRLAVVGGGFVGAEVASTAVGLGVEVTLLEAGVAPFARVLGAELGSILARRYRDYSVNLQTNASVAGFRPGADGRVQSITLAEGAEIACDVALVAVGAEPARELHDAAGAPSVHVCGDAAGGPGHWTAASTSGIDVARRMLGLGELAPQPPFFWSDQFGLRLQLVGDPHARASVELEGTGDDFVARYLGPSGRPVAVLAANRPAEVAAARRELALAA